MKTLKLKVCCQNLPTTLENVAVGPQQGKSVEVLVFCNEGQAEFCLDFRIKKNEKTGAPNFLGPFAQGSVADRFFYLVWLRADGEEMVRFARSKIKLKPICWEMLNQVGDGGEITAVINCQKEDGGLIFATVPQGNIEWQL